MGVKAGAVALLMPLVALSAPSKTVLEYRHHMFDPPVMSLANRTIEMMFDTVRILPGKDEWQLPAGSAPLDFTYEFQGKSHSAQDALEDTYTDALLIIKDGAIVNETYLNRTDEHTHFMSYSMAKTLNSVMMGFAIEDGYVKAVTDPVVKYIPELKGTAYDGATLQDVLRMRSGSDWDDNFFRPGPAKDINEQAFMLGEKRFVSAALTAKRAHPPGSVFNYNTVDAAVIGLVLERAVGEPISRYMQRKLWQPAGMESYGFYVLDGPPGVGREFTGGGFNAVLRDYGRLGLMMLQGGMAHGKRLLQSSWVKESTAATTTPAETRDPNLGYGYFWWTVAGTSAYTALGGEGQFIFVDPATQTVIVKFSHSPIGPKFQQTEAESIAFFKAASQWHPQVTLADSSRERCSAAGCAADQSMTREKYAEYIQRFNSQDERYADLYSEGVVFEHGPVYGNLHGRQAVVDFYRNAWKSFSETLVPGQVVIDNDKGLMAVELTTRLVARVNGVTSPSRPQGMKVGDELIVVGVVIYETKNGRITRIRGAPDLTRFEPAPARTARAPFVLAADNSATESQAAAIEASYRHYVDCFNRQDVACFTNYYDHAIVFLSSALPEMNGPEEIARFYRNAWQYLHEHIVIRGIELSHDKLVADLENTIDVLSDFPDFPPRSLRKGEHFTLRGKVFYELRAGRFTRISDGAG